MTASENYMEPTTKDLSGIPENQRFPSYGSSMNGGNATSKQPVMGAEGSDSEGYALVWDTAHHDYGDPTAPTDYGTDNKTPEEHVSTDEKGTAGGPLHHSPWKVI